MKWLIAGLLLAGCANHSHDPKSCRERAAYNVADVYPDPNNLALAINAICQSATD